MKNITKQDVLDQFAGLDRRHVQNQCSYIYQEEGRTGHCIVGKVLLGLGLPLPREIGQGAASTVAVLFEGGAYRLAPDTRISPDALLLLNEAQTSADGGVDDDTSWGTAIDRALKRAPVAV